MILRIMTTRREVSANVRDKRWQPCGFTLIELVIVLAIISAMVMVIMPYATKSNESLKLNQECLNIAETVRYAINLSVNSRKPIRIVIDPKNKSYSLETGARIDGQNFKPIEDIQGSTHYLGRNIEIKDVDGFSIEKEGYYLVFDPARAWPEASISLSNSGTIKIIKIRREQVEIEDSEI